MSTKDLTRREEALPSIFHDFFKPWDKWFDTNGGSLSRVVTVPAGDIAVKQGNYEISLAGPGMKNKVFYIYGERKILQTKTQTEETKGKQRDNHPGKDIK